MTPLTAFCIFASIIANALHCLFLNQRIHSLRKTVNLQADILLMMGPPPRFRPTRHTHNQVIDL